MMGPTDVEQPGVLSRLDRALARRHWIRLPLLFGLGLGASLLIGFYISPRYLAFCRVINRFASTCSDIPTRHVVGYSVVAFGVAMLILGPVVNSLYRLFRYGQKWETPRGPESAISNLPILAGFLYIAAGLVIALA